MTEFYVLALLVIAGVALGFAGMLWLIECWRQRERREMIRAALRRLEEAS